VTALASRIALAATAGGVLVVLLVYSSSLEAPFLVPKFTAGEVAASLGLLAFVLDRRGGGARRWDRRVAVCGWLVLVTTALSWLRSRSGPEGDPYAVEAVARWLTLFGFALGASVLVEDRRRLVEAITAAATTVAILGLLQHRDLLPSRISIPVISVPGSTFGNRNLASEVMVMAIPFGVAAVLGPHREGRIPMAVATALELGFLGVTRTRGAWLAAFCGVVVVVWIMRARLSRRVVVVSGAAALVAAMVTLVPAHLNTRDTGDTKRYSSILTVVEDGFDVRSPAFRTRLGIWRRSMRMIADHPWLGVGPGNWPVMFPRYAEPDASREGVLSATLAPRQAHDDYVERTAETGIIGMAALVAFGAAIGRVARRRLGADGDDDRAVTTGAVGALVTLLALFTSFPLEMPGTIVLAGVAVGLVVTEERAAPARGPWGSGLFVPALLASLALLIVVPVRAERRIRGSAALGEAERALKANRGVPGAETALEALKRCLDATPNSYLAELRTAQMLLREKRSDEAVEAAERAIALEPYAPNSWGVLGAAHRQAGHVTQSRDAASRGLELMHDYPLALDVRADAEEALEERDAERADRERLRDLAEHSEDEATRRVARSLSGVGQ
jgi:O-antigen ligase